MCTRSHASHTHSYQFHRQFAFAIFAALPDGYYPSPQPPFVVLLLFSSPVPIDCRFSRLAAHCIFHIFHFRFRSYLKKKKKSHTPPSPASFTNFLRFVRLSWPTVSSPSTNLACRLLICRLIWLLPLLSPCKWTKWWWRWCFHSPGEQFVAQSFVARPRNTLYFNENVSFPFVSICFINLIVSETIFWDDISLNSFFLLTNLKIKSYEKAKCG